MTDSFDLIVIGSGAGLNVAYRAHSEGWNVALVEGGLLGGTCLNTGCIPSKILIYPADVIRMMQDASRIGIEASVERIDFDLIMNRMRSLVDGERADMEAAFRDDDAPRWFREMGVFVGDHLLQVGSLTITSPRIVIATGARALIPPIPGLEKAGYLDNVSAFGIREIPKSIVILGGGYIACEFGHFFSAMGSEVTIVGRNPRLLPGEDPRISELFRQRVAGLMNVHTGQEAVRVEVEGDRKVVLAKDRISGEVSRFTGDQILVAAGRRSNADLLHLERTGVEVDRAGWIRVNEYLETTSPGIWSLGDAIGKAMFRHSANAQASVVSHNLMLEDMQSEEEKAASKEGRQPQRIERTRMDFRTVPHAVFCHPPVSGVGMTPDQAAAAGYDILVGEAAYKDVAKGYAMDEEGLAMAVVDARTGRILGFHVVGHCAPELVQQIVYVMNAGDGSYAPLAHSQVIHPALSEVVVRAFANMDNPLDHHAGHDHTDSNAG
ncbi:MAG TPA: dihydrolipoyl dehydrogenase [Methanotrichaceae archaeon]|nr:dihydrolipoyl dehydrogenase [Methanotrichaceae archaeon]HQF15640.1 dihydrolipoyl dehydrogenase [Methanotrichaceae archaeon]HQI90376.1 dihydrolipoyl dehydrogenase [Methanotrichaceae archaeon]HQJ28620.1 dihydrolipoyl dehydrogenase [Methanotrichaceae archaeon]